MTQGEVKEIRVSDQASAEYIRLLGYVSDLPDGYMITYEEAQREAAVEMDRHGRSLLRQAILKCGREYAVVTGTGYKLANADLTMPIMTKRFVSIDNRIRRAEQAHKALMEFRESLTEDERRGFDFAGAVFGAIRVAAENGKHLYGKEIHQLSQGQPVLPEYSETEGGGQPMK